jgi:hypothetical protein
MVGEHLGELEKKVELALACSCCSSARADVLVLLVLLFCWCWSLPPPLLVCRLCLPACSGLPASMADLGERGSRRRIWEIKEREREGLAHHRTCHLEATRTAIFRFVDLRANPSVHQWLSSSFGILLNMTEKGRQTLGASVPASPIAGDDKPSHPPRPTLALPPRSAIDSEAEFSSNKKEPDLQSWEPATSSPQEDGAGAPPERVFAIGEMRGAELKS